jgi:hypothetical protein
MAYLPVKTYRLGNCQAAIFESDYQGKKSHSIKLSKSYKTKDGKWNNTDFFYLTDIPALHGLLGAMINNQVKTSVPQQQQKQIPAPQQPEELNFDDIGSEEVPF